MKTIRIIIVISIVVLSAYSCSHNNRTSIVNDYIDSIVKANTQMTHFGKSETFWEDEYMYGSRRKQWVYTDSIEKYCNKEDLVTLYKEHESPVIRMVSFHLLLKNYPKEAVLLAIDDLDDTDSLLGGKCDQALEESASSIRIRLIQQWPKKYNITAQDSLAVDSAVRKSPNRESIWYFQHKCDKN